MILKAMDAVRADNAQTVVHCLLDFADSFQEIGLILGRIYEKCDPEVFYHRIRPFLAGSKNMEIAGLSSGVFYDEGNGAGRWRQYSGGSNAQSSLIQLFDIVLGVAHSPTKNSKVIEVNPKAKHGFLSVLLDSPRSFFHNTNVLQEMRNYMPESHRRFLQYIESAANIRDYVETSSACNDGVAAAYNLAVARLTVFRDIHLKIVTRYIILPSQGVLRARPSGLNLAIASTRKRSREGLSGTGGTELIPFLKQSRDETRKTALN